MLNPEEPINISFYAEQLHVLQTDPNTRVVGSLGRMVASQLIVDTPFTEFDDRVMSGLDTTRVSDIDVLGTRPDLVATARTLGAANVDDLAFRDSDVSLECEDGLWILRSLDADFEEVVSPKVMKAVTAEVEGVDIVTVPLQTHLALHTLRPRKTRKDSLTETSIGYLLYTEFHDSGGIGRIDEREFLPFMRLRTRLQLRQRASTQRHSDERHSE